jgi:serine/threonine-protein kinase
VAFRIFLDMLAGLHAAHEVVDIDGRPLDVVHRDVSPQNMIVGLDGVSRLIDFGVAKAAHRLTETESGDLKGKYAYMSPEQVVGLPVDRRSDVFAAGVVLFETLTGVRLFAGEHAMETLRRVVDDPLPDLHEFPDVPPALHDIFHRALEKDLEHRIGTAAELAEMIETRVPVATHRRVAEWVAQHCGALLTERRALLDESRKAGIARTRPNLVLANDEATLEDVPPFVGAQRTAILVHGSTPRLPSPAVSEASPAGHTNVASSADLTPEVAPRSRRGRVLVGLLVMGAAASAVVVTMETFGGSKEIARGSSTVTPSGEDVSASAAAPVASAAPSASASAGAAPSTSTSTSASGDAGTSKKGPGGKRPLAPPHAPRHDDLQGDPYGSK